MKKLILVVVVILCSCSETILIKTDENKDLFKSENDLIYYNNNPYTGTLIYPIYDRKLKTRNTDVIYKKFGLKDGKNDGLFEEYFRKKDPYKQGEIKRRINYLDGEFHGLYEEFYINGQIERRVGYLNGEKHGKSEEYYEDEKPNEFANYKHGNLHGLKVEYERYIPKRFKNISREDTIHDIVYRSNFKDGELDGLLTYYNNGKIEREQNYLNGEMDGLATYYYENGNIEKKENYRKNKKDGLWEWYDESGELTYSKTYKYGSLSLNGAVEIMNNHCFVSGQQLIKYFEGKFDGNIVYFFYSLKSEMVNGKSYSCISMMAPTSYDILATDCKNSIIKVREWNKIPGSPKIYL
tara:strand:- start:626 stop:1681 length:1056 start_codon:yes stop_codon:yes gene_type:complete